MVEDAPKTETVNPSLLLAVESYKEDPTNPELNTRLWREFLPEVTIPDCNWTREQIAVPFIGWKGEHQKAAMIYLPDEYRGDEQLLALVKRFPNVRIPRTKDDYYRDPLRLHRSEVRPGEWIKIEAAIDSPNKNTTQEDLEVLFTEQGRLGQRREVYILGSQHAHLTQRRYFDPGTGKARLLGTLSYPNGWTIPASATLGSTWYEGRFIGGSVHENDRDRRLGGRSEEVRPGSY